MPFIAENTSSASGEIRGQGSGVSDQKKTFILSGFLVVIRGKGKPIGLSGFLVEARFLVGYLLV